MNKHIDFSPEEHYKILYGFHMPYGSYKQFQVYLKSKQINICRGRAFPHHIKIGPELKKIIYKQPCNKEIIQEAFKEVPEYMEHYCMFISLEENRGKETLEFLKNL